MGGTEPSEGAAMQGKSSFAKTIKKWIPGIIWETLKDIRLLRFDESCYQRLKQVIADVKPDLIYERCNYMQLSGVRAAKEYNVTHFLEVNAPYTEERIEMSGRSLLAEKAHRHEALQLEMTNRVFVVSQTLGEYFHRKHNISFSKITSVPNAINPADITVSERNTQELAEYLGLRDRWVIGFVGSIFPYHGVDILIDAFARFSRMHADASLLIVGDGEILGALKEKVKNYGLSDKVIFTGNVNHAKVFDYISLMNVTVLARSNWYCSPVKIFEYGYMGQPIIAPNTAPIHEVMENGKDGIVINPNVEELYNSLMMIKKDREKHEAMGIRFREKVIKEHTWDSVAQCILEKVTSKDF